MIHLRELASAAQVESVGQRLLACAGTAQSIRGSWESTVQAERLGQRLSAWEGMGRFGAGHQRQLGVHFTGLKSWPEAFGLGRNGQG